MLGRSDPYALNFTLITNDDNTILVSLTGLYTSLPIDMTGAAIAITIYLPGTTTSVLTYPGTPVDPSSFQFTIPHADVAPLAPGHYPWVAIVTLTDGSIHTVNTGNLDLTTGLIQVVQRPGGVGGCQTTM